MYTFQLMNYVTCPPALTSDPVRLVTDFPKWLEKVSSRLPGGIVLVIDSADHFQVMKFVLVQLYSVMLTFFVGYLYCSMKS
jgi:hypothetical protein